MRNAKRETRNAKWEMRNAKMSVSPHFWNRATPGRIRRARDAALSARGARADGGGLEAAGAEADLFPGFFIACFEKRAV